MTTDQRLARLERQCRLFKAGFALTAITLVTVLLVGAGQDQEKGKVLEEVRAKSFVLVDANASRELAMLKEGEGAYRGFPELAFRDESDRLRLRMGVRPPIGPFLYLLDTEGWPRLFLGVPPDKGPRIGVSVEDGSSSAVLEQHDKAVALTFIHKGGERAMLRIADGAPELTMCYGGSTLLAIKPDLNPMLRLLDKDGKVVFKAPE